MSPLALDIAHLFAGGRFDRPAQERIGIGLIGSRKRKRGAAL